MSSTINRIGILTYTSNFNLGTFFQAYATLCSVRSTFPDSHVEIIDYTSRTKQAETGYDRLNLKKRHIVPSFLYRHLLRQHRYRDAQKKYLEIDGSRGLCSDSYEDAAEFIRGKSCDLIIVGSDTVLNFYGWNVSQKELPVYWLPPELSGKKVMLASSVGTALTVDRLDTWSRESLVRSAQGFSMIGVRDGITRDFILKLAPHLESRLSLVPDPTFSYDVDPSHAQAYLERRRIDPETPLIGLDLPLGVSGVEAAVEKFKSKGFRVVSWRGGNRISDYDFSDMSPLQWSGMFAHYDITLTNRFHASIFSLKNLTPVIAMDCKPNRVTVSNQSKISLLLKAFGMEETHYRNAMELGDHRWVLSAMESNLSAPPTEKIAKGLDEMKHSYESYLQRIKNEIETGSR